MTLPHTTSPYLCQLFLMHFLLFKQISEHCLPCITNLSPQDDSLCQWEHKTLFLNKWKALLCRVPVCRGKAIGRFRAPLNFFSLYHPLSILLIPALVMHRCKFLPQASRPTLTYAKLITVTWTPRSPKHHRLQQPGTVCICLEP